METPVIHCSSFLFAAALFVSSVATAAPRPAEVTWGSASEFTDIQLSGSLFNAVPTGTQTQDDFTKQVQNFYENTFLTVAGQYLKPGQSIEIHVLDVDLAGSVAHSRRHRQLMRMERSGDSVLSQLTVDYTLVDKNGSRSSPTRSTIRIDDFSRATRHGKLVLNIDPSLELNITGWFKRQVVAQL